MQALKPPYCECLTPLTTRCSTRGSGGFLFLGCTRAALSAEIRAPRASKPNAYLPPCTRRRSTAKKRQNTPFKACFRKKSRYNVRTQPMRMDGRAVECNGLENRRRFTSSVSSNLTPSAIQAPSVLFCAQNHHSSSHLQFQPKRTRKRRARRSQLKFSWPELQPCFKIVLFVWS